MRVVLLDRDGVVTVNRKDHIKSPAELVFVAGAIAAIARLSRAGVHVAICTNQPEVAKGVIDRRMLTTIHRRMVAQSVALGARIDLVISCVDDCPSPARKPEPGMLLQALRRFGALPARTPFIGDQLSDLEAAHRAGCRPVLVRTGLGSRTIRNGIPHCLRAVVHDDLPAAIDAYLRASASVPSPAIAHENQRHEAYPQRHGRDDAESHGHVSRSRYVGSEIIFAATPTHIKKDDREAEKAEQHR